MNTYSYLFWGYTVFWLAIAGYVLWIGGKLLATDRRLAEVERRLANRTERSRTS